jgi:hypothetical protein
VKEETEKGREDEKIDVTKQREGKRERKDDRKVARKKRCMCVGRVV